jgi:large subunit ribosomal protein L25
MAKQIKLAAQARPHVGRSAVKKIKKQGLVPAVVYGAKQQPQHVQLSAREIANVLSHATGEHLLVELEIADGSQSVNRLALIQEVQHHPLRGDVLHVDFHAVSADEEIHAEIPLQTTGEPNGVRNFGGLLEVLVHSLEVSCLPKDLPDVVTLDVAALNLNESLHVRDIPLPAGVKTRVDPDITVVRVTPPVVQEVETPAAAAAAPVQPEVIKEKKVEETEKKPEKK